MQDPLRVLPVELVLRCIEFTPLSGLATLSQSSKAWHEFLEYTHQDTIYSQQAHLVYSSNPNSDREELQLGRDISSFGQNGQDKSFVQYLHGVGSWKDLCKRFVLLQRNWTDERPVVRESVIQVGSDPIWRFKPDFKRRFIVSTSQSGGVNVTDMDTGRSLWRLSKDDVRMCAHLEYDQESGIACWDRMGNAIEVWKADEVERGTFHHVTILNHNCETRGFQLSRFNGKECLCVVSSEGKGFVWDLSQQPPQQQTLLEIEDGAAGHLDQGRDVIMYSMGERGYHVHSKETGGLIGALSPKLCPNTFHIHHPAPLPEATVRTAHHGPTRRACPPQDPRKDRLIPLRLHKGVHPEPSTPLTLENDEWGSGMISGNYMAGVSRGGRIFICTDLHGALADPNRFNETTAILQTQGDGSTFELGGWLNIKNKRIVFEIKDRVYIFSLPDMGQLPETGQEQRPIWATPTSSAPALAVPVSFMGIYDDCLMYTYTTLGFPIIRPRGAGDENGIGRDLNSRPFPTKAIRVLSLAPDLSAGQGKELDYEPGLEVNNQDIGDDTTDTNHGLQTGLLQLMALLTGTDDDSEDEIDDETRERLEAQLTEEELQEDRERHEIERDQEEEHRQHLMDAFGFEDPREEFAGVPHEGLHIIDREYDEDLRRFAIEYGDIEDASDEEFETEHDEWQDMEDLDELLDYARVVNLPAPLVRPEPLTPDTSVSDYARMVYDYIISSPGYEDFDPEDITAQTGLSRVNVEEAIYELRGLGKIVIGQPAPRVEPQPLSPNFSDNARTIYNKIMIPSANPEGYTRGEIVEHTGLSSDEVAEAARELIAVDMIYPTVDCDTWALPDYEDSGPFPPNVSDHARATYDHIISTPQNTKGLSTEDIAAQTGLSRNDVAEGVRELDGLDKIYATINGTWAPLVWT